MNSWTKKFHDWNLQQVNTRWGMWSLFICAFADASFLPLPTPIIFLTLALLNIKKTYSYALSGTLGTFTGALAGYSIGHFAWLDSNGEFTGLAQFLFNNVPGFTVSIYDKIHLLYTKWDFWILFIASILPLPYKIFSISSGVFDINIFIFCTTTLISQGIKFFFLGLLVIKIGPEAMKLLQSNLKPIAIIATAGIAIAIVAIKVF
jgi:membrane protein YqaA with SNARE-associated domain